MSQVSRKLYTLFCFININKFTTFENHFAKVANLYELTLDAEDLSVGKNKRNGLYELLHQQEQLKTMGMNEA